jgi:hypothetical protein
MERPTRFAEPELVLFVTGVAVAVSAKLDVLQVVSAIPKHLTSKVGHIAVD